MTVAYKPQYTKIRKRAEERVANIRFRDAIVKSQHRANLRAERDRLHGLLYHQLHPALHEKISTDATQIRQMLAQL